ncbi:carbon storage regulator [bacterium]|nr:carbon storage regulator [bacterium]
MLVISRKNGQKIMINDNIVITVVEAKNGQCKLAIDADRDVKIYREEIYYQVKLANLVGKNTNINEVDSVSSLLKDNKLELNKNTIQTSGDNDIELEEKSTRGIRINKQSNKKV